MEKFFKITGETVEGSTTLLCAFKGNPWHKGVENFDREVERLVDALHDALRGEYYVTSIRVREIKSLKCHNTKR